MWKKIKLLKLNTLFHQNSDSEKGEKSNSFNLQRGVSLYLSVLIIGILLAIALGLSTITLIQIKVIREMGDSVIAFYAADTGIEDVFYRETQGESVTSTCTFISPCIGDLGDPDRRYSVIGLTPGGDCGGTYYCLESVGFYKNTRRAIRITR